MSSGRAAIMAKPPVVIASFLLLAACADATGPGTAVDLSRPGSSEQACVQAVSVNAGGGRPAVLRTERSGNATVVLVRSADGAVWRCAATGTVVTDLAVA